MGFCRSGIPGIAWRIAVLLFVLAILLGVLLLGYVAGGI